VRAALVALVVAAVAAGLALAQSGGGRAPVLHEYLPPPANARPSPIVGRNDDGKNPTAFAAGDKVLPKPSIDQPDRKVGEPVLGTKQFGADRDTVMRPDENTGPDSTLHYASVFNPDVLPFKRMSAFDKVDETETLSVAQKDALSELQVGGSTDPARDRFWGSVLVELKPGKDVALPSVAPDMRILSYEVKPRVALRFSKDGADNFYVRSDESSASGTYRLVFLADADAGYFAPSLPPHAYRVRDVKAKAPLEILPSIPDRVLRQAEKTLRDNLRIDRDEDLAIAFNKLVGYFRSFQAGEIKSHSGSTYRDLCDSRTGVCRHRSFAFMITANALGIPTRFVENEAHAFVEVWFPERGWQRIDLGGAALRMEVTGADNKTLHRPRAEDPFAKPPEYKQSYTQLEGEIHGLTDQQLADKKKPLDQAPPSGAFGRSAPGNAGTGNGAGSSSGDRITPDPRLDVVAPDPQKPTPTLHVTRSDVSAYRGDAIHVEGVVQVNGKGVGDRVIDVYLAPAGERGKNPIELGRVTSRADGTFRADLVVPPATALATYEVFLASSEDAYYNAALSE
jgi:transglutaminase-like putative cysteine protease